MNFTIFYEKNPNLNYFEKFCIYQNNFIIKEFYYYFPFNFSLIRCTNYNYYDIISKIDFSEFVVD